MRTIPKYFENSALPPLIIQKITPFLILFPLYFSVRLGFDGGHEGYLATTAIAQANGYLIFRDYFSLYGPILPIFHSLIANFEPSYISILLRISDDFVTVGIIYGILSLRKKVSCLYSISSTIFYASALTWLYGAYFLFGMEQHAWSSNLATFIQILILNSFLRNESNSSRFYVKFKPALVAVLLLVLLLTRLNVGILSILALLLYTFLAANKSQAKLFIQASFFFVFFLFIFIVTLWRIGILENYFLDSILIPKRVFTDYDLYGPNNWNSIPVLVNYFFKSIPFILVFFFIAKFKNIFFNFLLNLIFFTSPLLIVSTLIFYFFGPFGTPQSDFLFKVYQRHLVFLMCLGIMAALSILVLIIKSWIKARILKGQEARESNSPIDSANFLILLFGIAGIAQVFPTHDARHIWWGLPLLILGTYIFLTSSERRFPNLDIVQKLLGLVTVFSILLGSLGLFSNMSSDRRTIDFEVAAKGLQVYPDEYLKMKTEFEFLKTYLPSNQKAFFQCGEGETHWIPSFDLIYHSKSKWFIDLSFYKGYPQPDYALRKGDILVICGNDERQRIIADKFDVEVIESIKSIGLAIK
jgi:hypothetical protein